MAKDLLRRTSNAIEPYVQAVSIAFRWQPGDLFLTSHSVCSSCKYSLQVTLGELFLTSLYVQAVSTVFRWHLVTFLWPLYVQAVSTVFRWQLGDLFLTSHSICSSCKYSLQVTAWWPFLTSHSICSSCKYSLQLTAGWPFLLTFLYVQAVSTAFSWQLDDLSYWPLTIW